jgi:hypothetical protein
LYKFGSQQSDIRLIDFHRVILARNHVHIYRGNN